MIGLNDNTRLKPWRMEGTSMQPQILLMSKLIFLILTAHGFFYYIDDPFIPFLQHLDVFNQVPGLFKNTLRAGYITFGIMLLFNIRVRVASVILGMIIIIAIIASKPVFRNHLFIVGCALLLAGLTEKEGHPWLINFQLSLVYLGAFINKVFDIDWWSGIFMHNWMQYGRENLIYIYTSSLFPDYWFAIFLSWIAIFAELFIGVLILSKKWRITGVWIAVIFHSALFTMIGIRFTHFMDAIFIMFLAFLVWPKDKVYVTYQEKFVGRFKKIIHFLDWEKKMTWEKSDRLYGSWLNLQYGDIVNSNIKALRSTLLYSTGFYVLLFVLNLTFVFLIDHRFISYFFTIFFLWGSIIFFLPIPWNKILKKST